MEKFGFLVALIVTLFGMTTSRPPICEKPPPWRLNQVDHMKNNLGNVTIVALLKGSCPFCLWQASKLSYMLRDFASANLTDIKFLVINDDEMASRQLFGELKNKAKPIPVYQDKIEQDRNQTVWSLLNGGKDDFYIYDRCGRLAYYVPLPISFLYRPYAKAAILSTYFEEPCGPCPVPLPPITEISNCSVDRNDSSTESSNCTLITNELNVNVTDIFVNETVNATNIKQENETLNSSTTTISPLKAKFNPVIEELQEYFKNRSSHHHRKSNSTFHHKHHHQMPHMHGGRFKFDDANRSLHHDHNLTKSGKEFGRHFGHGHGMDRHHGHRHHNSSKSFNATEIPRQKINETFNLSNNVTKNETNIDDLDVESNITITTTENPVEKLSSTFYRKYFPNYELVLNKALENWLNVPISANPVKKIKNQTSPTTPQPLLITIKATTAVPLSPGNIQLTHREKLIHALKQRQNARTSQ